MGGGRNKPDTSTPCPRCGKSPGHDKLHCPARTATCRRCKKRGHFQAVCRSHCSKHSANVSGVETDDNSAFMGAVSDKPGSPWTVTIELNDKPVLFTIDTGADVTVISSRIWREIGQPPLSQSDRTLRCPDEHSLKVKGMFKGTLKSLTHQASQPVYRRCQRSKHSAPWQTCDRKPSIAVKNSRNIYS